VYSISNNEISKNPYPNTSFIIFLHAKVKESGFINLTIIKSLIMTLKFYSFSEFSFCNDSSYSLFNQFYGILSNEN